MNNDDKNEGLRPWWHTVSLAEGSAWHYQIGPLHIYLARQNNEWWLASESMENGGLLHGVLSEAVDQIPEGLVTARYVFQQAPESFCLKPRLLDRPVVVKAKQSVNIPPGQRIEFFISSPVCIQVVVESPQLVLQELLSARLSDTWFGPSTREGELCYASKTEAHRSMADLPWRPHRAITPVTVVNQSSQLLAVDKLSIPLPYLAVYGRSDGSLWTQPVTLEQNEPGGLANFVVGNPDKADQLLNESRIHSQKSGLVRAFASLFGN